jgi:hypothetical protein
MPFEHWYKTVTPREDLGESKQLDAREVAALLNQIGPKKG